MNPIIIRIICFLVGTVIGGGLVFGVIELTEITSGSGNQNATGTRVNESLKLVVVLSRHGNKVAEKDYPLDPFPVINKAYWPYEAGALTSVGRIEVYKLGEKLRSFYNGFLPSTFNTNDIYACSDTMERVMMSGELVLAGLYPPVGWQAWNTDVNWQPIPLYTNSSDHTMVMKDCLRYILEEKKALPNFLENEAANISEIMNIVHNLTGVNSTVKDLADMFKKFTSEEAEGYTLADWTSNIYPKPLSDLYAKYFENVYAGTDEVVRLWIGDFLEEVVGVMEKKINGSLAPDRIINFFSGHETTILNLQIAIGVPRPNVVKIINFASALIIELHQDSVTGDYTVEVLYVDGSSLDSEPESFALPTCGTPCLFQDFLNSTLRFREVDFEQECQATE